MSPKVLKDPAAPTTKPRDLKASWAPQKQQVKGQFADMSQQQVLVRSPLFFIAFRNPDMEREWQQCVLPCPRHAITDNRNSVSRAQDAYCDPHRAAPPLPALTT